LNTKNRQKKLHDFWRRRGLFLTGLVMTIFVSCLATQPASALYILTGAEDTAIVLDKTTRKIPDLSEHLVYVSSGKSGYDVKLTSGRTVNIHHNGTVITARSRNEKISALLSRNDIELSPLEMVAVDLSGEEYNLTIDDHLTYFDKVVETFPYETIRVPNPDMKEGTERVVQAGVTGQRTAIYEVIWSNGQQLSRQFVEELDSSVVNEIVEYGTSTDTVAPSDPIVNIEYNENGGGTLVFASGSTLNFSGVKSMTATAYTAGHGGVDTCTATGTFVRKGVVAVDKKVIPLGTRMYIVTDDGIVYGMGVAEDTGVRGNKIDLYHDTYQQCIQFGRRSCTVYILE